MKKIIPIIGLCSILHFSSPTLIKDDYIQVKSGKGHVYIVSESEGNKQLHEVAKIAGKEDAWVYLAGRWYDVGTSEQEDNVSINLDYVAKLLKKHKNEKEAKYAHIHPKRTTQGHVAPPSTYDIFTHGKLKRMLKDKLQMKLSASEIYTGDGVWTYDITDSLENDIDNTKLDSLGWMILSSMILKETLLISGNKSSSKEKKIEDYISAVKKFGIIASYKSLENKKL